MNVQIQNIVPLALALAALLFNLSVIQPAQAQSFLPTGSLNTERAFHTATLLPNGKVLVAGGYNNVIGYLSSAELYDPATGNWTTTGALKTVRSGGATPTFTATLLSNGKVLVAGGTPDNGSSYLFSAELYDPATGNWTFTGAMKTNHSEHTATLLPNGKVLVAGGECNSGMSDSAELYDPATGRWTLTGAMTTKRVGHSATLLPNGKVLVAGEIYNISPSAELYDPATGTWAETGAMNTALAGHTAILLLNGKVLAAGGYGDSSITNLAELYDPATETWVETGAMTASRIGHTATLLPNAKVLVAGIWNFVSQITNSAELYDPATGTWAETGALNTGRSGPTATLLPNGRVLVAGGRDDWHPISSAELYDSATGTVTVLSNLAKLPNGTVQFAFTNTPGATLTVLATTNLSLSLSNWTPLGWATETSSGHFQFTDSQATNGGQRFYRVRWP